MVSLTKVVVAQTQTINLMDLVRRYRTGRIKLPEWQRDKVWTPAKKKKFRDRVVAGGAIPGMLITFRLPENQYDVDASDMLNDGWQRLSTLVDWYEKEIKKKTSNVEEALLQSEIQLQKLVYPDMKSAFEDFFNLQLGTSCTPREYGLGILKTELKHFDDVWMPILQRLHNEMKNLPARTGVNKSKIKQGAIERDDLGLMFRFTTQDIGLESYHTSRGNLGSAEMKDPKTMVEYRLQAMCNEVGPEKFSEMIDVFCDFKRKKIAYYETFWKKYGTDSLPTAVHLRFWLTVAIYANNVGKDLDEFTQRFVECTSGDSGWEWEPGRRITCGAGEINKLNLWCERLRCAQL